MVSLARIVFAAFALASITQTVAQEPHEHWLKFMQGRWQVQMPDGTNGICTWRSIASTPAVNFECTTSPEFSIVGVFGWRADEKVFIETDFVVEDGKTAILERRYDSITDSEIAGKQTYTQSDGTNGEESLVYKKFDENKFTLSGSGNRGNWTVTFVRDTPALHLAVLKPFIGSWRYQGSAPDDIVGIKKGDKIEALHTFKWALGKNAATLEWSVIVNGKEVDAGSELMGWDKSRGAIRSIMQTKSGSQDQGTWSSDGSTLTWTGTGFDASGKSTAARTVFTKIGEDSYTWEILDQKVDGEAMPPSQAYEYQRVK